MTLLNSADRIYLGSQQVDRIYLGTHQVWPSTALPAISLGAVDSAGYTGDNTRAAVTINTVSGGALAIAVVRALDTATPATLNDTFANTFTLQTSTPLWAFGDYGVSIDVYTCIGFTGGSGHQIEAVLPYAQYPAIYAAEVRGASVVLDGAMAAGEDASSPFAAPALTRSAAGVVVSFLAIDSRGGPLTPACAGLTLRSNTAFTNENLYYPGAMAADLVNNADPFTAEWTMPGITNAPEAAIAVLAFKLGP